MKLLALSIGGYTIGLPNQVTTLNNASGPFGVGILRLAGAVMGTVAILLAFFVLMYAGWLWITSEGDKKKIETSQQTLVWAIAGLIVVALAYFIVNILGAFFHVPILTVG